MEEKMELTELKAEKVMTIRANCPDDMRIPVGKNDFGLLRAIYITGGEFHGARINGTVFPMGGADWNTGFGGDAPSILPAWRFTRGICSRQMMVCLSRYRIPGSVINGAGSLIL